MSTYTPDNWVIIFLNGLDPHYRVLAGWSGGYAQGDSWRMNSGIVRCEETTKTGIYNNEAYTTKYFSFFGSSGSCYLCHKDTYGLRMNNAYIWDQLEKKYGDKVQLMDENTDWLSMNWIIE
jgi:V8-like Glu-specific endopeptidase